MVDYRIDYGIYAISLLCRSLRTLSSRTLKRSTDGVGRCLIFLSRTRAIFDSDFLPTGKGGGGLNLGNFFASHKGYSRKGFDRLSTEGSDQEKDEDDGTDSEEEYSAPAPPQALSSS